LQASLAQMAAKQLATLSTANTPTEQIIQRLLGMTA
jgi:hypothetical protein